MQQNKLHYVYIKGDYYEYHSIWQGKHGQGYWRKF